MGAQSGEQTLCLLSVVCGQIPPEDELRPLLSVEEYRRINNNQTMTLTIYENCSSGRYIFIMERASPFKEGPSCVWCLKSFRLLEEGKTERSSSCLTCALKVNPLEATHHL